MNVYIAPTAQVSGTARVSGTAQVYGMAQVYGITRTLAERDEARRLAEAWRAFALPSLFQYPPSPDYPLPWERGE